MHRKSRRKEWIWAVAFLLLTGFLIHLAAGFLRPSYTVYGSTWKAFLAEPENSLDVVWLGSSVAYCDICPAVVYERTGLTGFVMAGGEQTMAITYWYLKEILKTQSPAAVVIEGTGVFFREYQSYTQQNITAMPLSRNRLGAILTGAEPELRRDLLFDLSFYHERWKSPGTDGFRSTRWDEYKGFTPMEGHTENAGKAEWVADRDISAQTYQENLAWLVKALELCSAHGIQAVVTIHPAYSRCTPEAYERLREELARQVPEALFCDWSESFDEIGLIPTEHLYDGMHLNQDGAAVFSAWLGEYLAGRLGLSPRAQTPENAAAWQKTAEYWRSGI